MANEKVLILEAPWSGNIEDTQATRDIYVSAETLLRSGAKPARVIYRPLISTTYKDDIKQFVELDCNQRGPNVIVLSAHGEVVRRRVVKKRGAGGRRVLRRRLEAFDGDINLSRDIRSLHDKLSRSIVVLDACDVGVTLNNFREISGALAVVGFAKEVDWVDSSMFVLAMLFKLRQEGVLSLKRATQSTEKRRSRVEIVIKAMIDEQDGPYASLAKSLGVRTALLPSAPSGRSSSLLGLLGVDEA